jgi:hypothetical protein
VEPWEVATPGESPAVYAEAFTHLAMAVGVRRARSE